MTAVGAFDVSDGVGSVVAPPGEVATALGSADGDAEGAAVGLCSGSTVGSPTDVGSGDGSPSPAVGVNFGVVVTGGVKVSVPPIGRRVGVDVSSVSIGVGVVVGRGVDVTVDVRVRVAEPAARAAAVAVPATRAAAVAVPEPAAEIRSARPQTCAAEPRAGRAKVAVARVEGFSGFVSAARRGR